MVFTVQEMTSIVAVVVAIVGFGAVVIQLKQVERGLRSSACGSIYDMASRMKDVFVEHPELRPYFNGEKELKQEDNEELYQQIMTVADYYCLYLEQIATLGENFSKPARKAWFAFARDVYQQSPPLQEFLKTKRSWYAPEFWVMIDDHLED